MSVKKRTIIIAPKKRFHDIISPLMPGLESPLAHQDRKARE